MSSSSKSPTSLLPTLDQNLVKVVYTDVITLPTYTPSQFITIQCRNGHVALAKTILIYTTTTVPSELVDDARNAPIFGFPKFRNDDDRLSVFILTELRSVKPGADSRTSYLRWLATTLTHIITAFGRGKEIRCLPPTTTQDASIIIEVRRPEENRAIRSTIVFSPEGKMSFRGFINMELPRPYIYTELGESSSNNNSNSTSVSPPQRPSPRNMNVTSTSSDDVDMVIGSDTNNNVSPIISDQTFSSSSSSPSQTQQYTATTMAPSPNIMPIDSILLPVSPAQTPKPNYHGSNMVAGNASLFNLLFGRTASTSTSNNVSGYGNANKW